MLCRRLVSTAIALASLAACGTGSGPLASTTTPGPTSVGAWSGVRTNDSGGLRIGFFGAPPALDMGSECAAQYSATAAESADEVTVIISAVSSPDSQKDCDTKQYAVSLDVPLSNPIGSRRVVDAANQSVYTVFDSSRLLSPVSLPADWELIAEGATSPEGGGTGWTRKWGLPRIGASSETCASGPSNLVLAQLPVVPDQASALANESETIDINGVPGTFKPGQFGGSGSLVWTTNDWHLALTAEAVCADDTKPTFEELTDFARSLS